MQSDKWRKMQNQFWLLWFLLDVHGRGIVAILIVFPLVWARVVAPRPISRWAHLKERLHRSRMCDPTKIGLTTPLNCYFLRSRLQHVSRVVCTWRLGDRRPALVSLVLLPLRLDSRDGVGEDGEQGLRWVYGTKLKQIRSAPLALGCSKRCIYSNLGCISSKTFIVRSNFHFFS